jgi:hypothetical protein
MRDKLPEIIGEVWGIMLTGSIITVAILGIILLIKLIF